MHVHVGPARVFDPRSAASRRCSAHAIKPGDVVVIRYEGPRANGMPEMYFATAIIAADPVLGQTTALITDGRYSGAMKGPCIGHVTPEAARRRPDRAGRGRRPHRDQHPGAEARARRPSRAPGGRAEIARALEDRRARWCPPPPRHTRGSCRSTRRSRGRLPRGRRCRLRGCTFSRSPFARPRSPNGEGQGAMRGGARDRGGDGGLGRCAASLRGGGGARATDGAPPAAFHNIKVVVLDYDFGDVDIERAIIEGAGFELVPAQCKSEDEVIDVGARRRRRDLPVRARRRARDRGVHALPCHRPLRHRRRHRRRRRRHAARHPGHERSERLVLRRGRRSRRDALARSRAQDHKYDAATRRGEWQWQTGKPIKRLRGRVFGLLSFGAIARAIAERARPFGVEVWAHDPFVDAERCAPTASGRSRSTSSSRARTTS